MQNMPEEELMEKEAALAAEVGIHSVPGSGVDGANRHET
jgi:hypothetical protein